MPHLQEKEVDDKLGRGGTSVIPSSELPIKEAREGYLSGSEGLPAMTTITSKKIQNSPVKVESFGSTEEPRRAVSEEEVSYTPRTHSMKQSVITPSPFGLRGMRGGPILTIFGNRKLIPSPIRVKRRVSTSEDDYDGTQEADMSQPTNLRYVETYATPSKLSHQVSDGSAKEDTLKKRLLAQLESEESKTLSPSKKSKPDRADSPEFTLTNSVAVNDDAAQVSPTIKSALKKKKPIISPTSSGEKGDDDESIGASSRGPLYPPYGPRGYAHHPPYPPQHPAYSHAPGYGPPPHPPAYSGYPMYNGYPPPPPPAHFMNGVPGTHPNPFYPPYPGHPSHHHPGMMRPFARAGTPGKFPPHFPGSPHRMVQGKPDMAVSADLPKGAALAASDRIKSVAEWQRAALSTGKPPSANRCVPLKEPIPSKFWGNAEKTKDVILPDFHRLVNFPDYLAKSRNSSSSDSNPTPAGKKNCVMCGKLRVCSASTLVARGRAAAANKSEEKAPSQSVSSEDNEDDGTAHIIPRQNKGLCTACDVTVWVVASDGLEIKWCKGCKNFRPWAAFGDKGSATKCVRCRERQREKYAMQKDEIRLRRYKRSNQNGSNTESDDAGKAVQKAETKNTGTKSSGDEDNQLAAARGLRNLMNAASV